MPVHPRERGEHVGRNDRHDQRLGSSPRARGTRPEETGQGPAFRFIPASAGNTRAGCRSSGWPPVHPRERGEHRCRCRQRPCGCGSSPRARGTLIARRALVTQVRFIPASAGNTSRYQGSRRHWPVHPRERGEHACRFEVNPLILRFIPASAGNTSSRPSAMTNKLVHPRERGEHNSRTCASTLRSGSSPRARGTPRRRQGQRRYLRFIPASAGNTCDYGTPTIRKRGSSPRARGTRRPRGPQPLGRRFIPASAGNTGAAVSEPRADAVHPRERGEHPLIYNTSRRPPGSSPRARGTHGAARLNGRQGRFIPASAGNTAATSPPKNRPAVHPRERGEHMVAHFEKIAPSGSSPRARGTRELRDRDADLRRFIPASAGNTPVKVNSSIGVSVHPRERGEHQYRPLPPSGPRGSSPRARGTQRPDVWHPRAQRFIPASAGNTVDTRPLATATTVHPRERGEHHFC